MRCCSLLTNEYIDSTPCNQSSKTSLALPLVTHEQDKLRVKLQAGQITPHNHATTDFEVIICIDCRPTVAVANNSSENYWSDKMSGTTSIVALSDNDASVRRKTHEQIMEANACQWLSLISSYIPQFTIVFKVLKYRPQPTAKSQLLTRRTPAWAKSRAGTS